MIRIVVIDNHILFRIGLITILNKNPQFNVVGEYKSFTGFKPAMSKVKPNLVLIDIAASEKENGFDEIKHIKYKNPNSKIIIISSCMEEFHIVNALESGVDGYIRKDTEPSELLMGIDKILAGEKFYSLEISNILIGSLSKNKFQALPSLTIREKEIIKNLMTGNSSKEIAMLLKVSPRTVETHRANILGKFGLKNTTELVSRISEYKIKL